MTVQAGMTDDDFAPVLESIDRFTRERLIPSEREVASGEEPPAALLQEMRELGLFGLTFPEEYGGLALNAEQYAEVGLVLGRVAPAIRNVLSIHNGIASLGIAVSGTNEQRTRYLPRLASGELIGAFALTEPDSGSDAASIKTIARRTARGWVLNGAKRFISNATIAGLFTVIARTPDDGGGISAFLVEPGTRGLSIGKPEQKMGQQGAPIAELTFDQCEVPDEALLGEAGAGFKIAMQSIDLGRLFIAACCVGLSYRLIEDATQYAMERKQFGKPIAQHQLVQAMLADSLTATYAAKTMVRSAARRLRDGNPIQVEASMCKMFATEMVCRVADRCVQIHGGNGYIRDYMVEQIYRDVRVLRIYEGTTQIQQLLIAKDLIRRTRDRVSLP